MITPLNTVNLFRTYIYMILYSPIFPIKYHQNKFNVKLETIKVYSPGTIFTLKTLLVKIMFDAMWAIRLNYLIYTYPRGVTTYIPVKCRICTEQKGKCSLCLFIHT